MRNSIFLFMTFLFFFFNCSTNNNQKNRITISGAFALYPLEIKWAEEFKKKYPNIKFDISAAGAGKGMVDVISGMADIGSISREISKEEEHQGIWWVAVARDAVVPTMNNKNPIVKEIMEKGLTKQQFAGIFTNDGLRYWSQVYDEDKMSFPINIYTRSDACGAASTWALFLNKKQEDLNGTGVFGDPGICDAVKKDIYAIGYNNINFIYNVKTKKVIEGLAVIPIDINGNGELEKEENFYQRLDILNKAITDKKYPSPPARDLYLAFKGKPKNIVCDFIEWVLTEGQDYIIETGYVPLTGEQIQQELNKIKNQKF